MEQDAEIISGPTPADTGNVDFAVRVGGHRVTVHVSMDGVGIDAGENVDAWNVASVLVDEYVAARRAEKLQWCLQAARLRRASGKPSHYDFPRLPHVQVIGEPVVRDTCVELAIGGAAVAHRVIFFRSFGILDECEDWDGLSEPERCAALAAAVDYAFANREKMAAAGLDMAILTELHGP